MLTIRLRGDLSANLDTFVTTFEGSVARATGSGLTASNGFPNAVSVTGSGLLPALSGEVFVTGTVSALKLQYGEIPSLSEPIRFTEMLSVEGLDYDAGELFSFVSRSGTSVYGRFEPAVFEAGLTGETVKIAGSRSDDTVAPNAWLDLAGNDRISTGAGDDAVSAGRGRDKVWGGAGDDVLRGDAGGDRLVGQAGKDTLRGGGGSDHLDGGQGLDRLFGDAGADRLDGGTGKNLLKGGAGADVFVHAAAGSDRIRDFRDDLDTLELDSGLWDGDLNRREVIRTYAEETRRGVVLDFGDGGTVTVLGLDDRFALVDDLVIV